MGEAKSKADWLRTSSLLAMIVNVNIDTTKHKPYKAEFFNPHYAKVKQESVNTSDVFDSLIKEFVR